MAEYDIWLNPRQKIIEWLQSLNPPPLVIKTGMADKIYVKYDHDQQEQDEFLEALCEQLTQVDTGNNTFSPLIKYLKYVKTDQVLYTTDKQITLTNIGSTFKNLFPHVTGNPILADFKGFTKLGFLTIWTKIGTGDQHMRINDYSGNITSDLINTQALGQGNGLVTGDNQLNNFQIPGPYINFKGKLRIQVRSTVAADSPVFDGMRIYARR